MIDIRTRVDTVDATPSYASAEAWRTVDHDVPAASIGGSPSKAIGDPRIFEECGFDSVFVPQMSTWLEVWTVSAWLLSATRTLSVAAAHRVGVQSPTSAARALATLDQLSGGRASVHVITGASDEDLQRDGDFLCKQDRYRRADEYLEIFRRWLTAEEPFDFDGEFYRVIGAERSLRGVQYAGPTISYGGASDESIALAARHADVYAMVAEPLAQTTDLVARVRGAAAGHGRSLHFWQVCNHILGRTDDEARAKAARLYAEQQAIVTSTVGGQTLGPGAVMRQRVLAVADTSDWHDATLFTGISRLTAGRVAAALVGSPETVSDALLKYYDLGVDIFGPVLSFDALLRSGEDRELREELFARLRAGAEQRDDQRRAQI